MKPTNKQRASNWVRKHGVSFSDDMRRDSQVKAFLAGDRHGFKRGKEADKKELHEVLSGKRMKKRTMGSSDSRRDNSKLVKDESLGVAPPACPKKTKEKVTR